MRTSKAKAKANANANMANISISRVSNFLFLLTLTVFTVTVFIVFSAATVWSKGDYTASTASTAVGVGEYQVIQVAAGATLRGIVRYAGAPPTRTRLVVDHDPETCAQHDIRSEDLIVSTDRGVRNAVVWLRDIRSGKAWPDPDKDKEVILDQEGCVYKPHVLVVGVGKPIKFVNSDPVIHNVNTFPRENPPLNISLLAKGVGRPVTRRLKLPDEIKVTCDAHKWMSARIIVRDNPYFAVTGDDGSYTIEGIPAGTYTMVVWHESLGKVEKKLQLTAGMSRVEDVEMKRR